MFPNSEKYNLNKRGSAEFRDLHIDNTTELRRKKALTSKALIHLSQLSDTLMDAIYKNTQIGDDLGGGRGRGGSDSISTMRSNLTTPPGSPPANNVDIMYSILGRQEPPQLPLREEFMTNGVELVYNAKGVGQKVVCQEQKRREAKLLQKLKLIERKLEKKKSYQQSKKRRKALDTVKKLRKAMEHSASGISYEMYLEELMKMRAAVHEHSNHSGVIVGPPRSITPVTSVEQIHGKLMDALELLDEQTQADVHSDIIHMNMPPVSLADEDDSDNEMPTSPGRSTGTADTSLETSMETSMETLTAVALEQRQTSISQMPEDDHNISVRTSEEKDSGWVGSNNNNHNNGSSSSSNNNNNNNSRSIMLTSRNRGSKSDLSTFSSNHGTLKPHSSALRTTPTQSTLKASNVRNIDGRSGDDDDNLTTSSFESNSSLNIVKSPSSSSVRFKDVKPTVDDNLSRARALIENAKYVQRSFSNESSSSNLSHTSSIKPSESYKTDRPILKTPKFVPDTGRYHLFVSHACSWSHRTLIVRALKGLESTVGVTYVKCKVVGKDLIDATDVKERKRDISFWAITGCVDDRDVKFRDFKVNFMDKHEDRTTRVPVLWDTVTKKIVTCRSTDIDWLFNFDFNRFARRPKLNLYPPGTKREIDEINRWIHDSLTVGIYQCGIATSQKEYDDANDHLTRTLDRAETIVRKRGFLTGQKLTEADIRLFVYLIRFDEIYRVLFKTNTRRIETMPGLLEYVKDIYHVKGIKDVCNIKTMKTEYFGALVREGDPFIVPQGSFHNILERKSAVV